MRRIVFASIVCLVYAMMPVIPVAAATEPGTNKETKPVVDLRKHPTGGMTPIDVAVGLYITNLVAIDETKESFEVGGYLTAQWTDPRLAVRSGSLEVKTDANITSRAFRSEDLWTPPIEAANSISHRTNSYTLEADQNGVVTYVERFDSTYSNSYPIRKFPFDQQVLRFEFQPFLASGSAIRFAEKPLPTAISAQQHIDLAQWRIQDLRYSAETLTGDGIVPPIREALFQIFIERRSGFYIWKIFLPLVMMTMISAAIFWTNAKEIGWLLNVPMTMLLSMVAFEFVVLRDLPRVGYVTFLDAVFLASFMWCFLAVVEVTAASVLQKTRWHALATIVHAAGRLIYPASYFGLVLVLAICFLV
jgi:hypothetical protein